MYFCFGRYDLKGHNFKVTALEEPPFITKILQNTISGQNEMEGSFIDLLNLLSKTMNFSYTLKLPPDNSWGGLQENGSWNGMMNLLINEIVDICKLEFCSIRFLKEIV